jgi:8-oxo-(d)GTP phosphatase
VGLAPQAEGALLVSDLVEAAGGVVTRGRPGRREILIVHRPSYDDWTLPKGKLEDGEGHEEAARREVEEETGWRCVLGPPLPEVRYIDRHDRPKRVRYWLMRPEDDRGFVATREIDETRWVPDREASATLSYGLDRHVLAAALALDEPVLLVRHAKASSRSRWEDDDDRRPLTTKGLRQAERLREHLRIEQLRHVTTSPSVRCVQTVEPLARSLGVPLEEVPDLQEGIRADQSLAFVQGLAGPSVACTHGDVMVDLVEPVLPAEGPVGWKKGATWILERDGGEVVAASYVGPPRDRAG